MEALKPTKYSQTIVLLHEIKVYIKCKIHDLVMDLGSILEVFWRHLGDMLVLFWVPWRVAFLMDSGGLQEFKVGRKLVVISRVWRP